MVHPPQILAALRAALEEQSPAALEAIHAKIRKLALSVINGGGNEPSFASQCLVKCAEGGLQLRHANLSTSTFNISPPVDLLALCADSLTVYFNVTSISSPTGAQSGAKGPSPEDQLGGAKDQFLCRAYYAEAQLHALQARDLKGADLKEEVLGAAEVALKGVRLAQELGPRHAFLVYNGSVHLWRIIRVLNRDGSRVHLLACFETITKALEWAAAQGVQQEEWRARNLLALAWCLAEAGQKDRAVIQAQECEKLATSGDVGLAAVALRVHLTVAAKSTGGAGKAKGELGKDAGTQARALLQVIRSTLPPPTSAVGSPPPGRKARASSPAPPSDGGDAEKQILEAWRLIDPTGTSLVASPSPTPDQVKAIDASAKGVDSDAVADVAWTSALAKLGKITERAAGRAAQGKSLAGRARADLSLCKIALDKETGPLFSDADLDAPAAARRADVIRRAEGSLSSFVRAGDCSGVEDACQLIWNAALPLLDPTRRHVAARAFRAAAGALEAVGSGMHRLRAQVHLELADLHQSEEMLSKAEEEARKGYELDYEAPTSEVETAGCDRPLDRLLEPLLKRMKLKRDIYNDPDRPMDKALLLIDQAREAKKADVQADLLTKAAAELTSAEKEEQKEQDLVNAAAIESREAASAAAASNPTPEPALKGSKGPKGKAGNKGLKGRETPSNETAPETSQKEVTFAEERFRQGAKERARLWAAVVQIAVEAKLWEFAHIHTEKVLGIKWGVQRDREMVLLQAEVAFLDSEACIGFLKERGVELLPPLALETTRKDSGVILSTPDGSANVGNAEKEVNAVATQESANQEQIEALAADPGASDGLTGTEKAAEVSFNARPFQTRAFGGFLEGAQKGLTLNEAWLVTNAASHLWNNHLPLIRAKSFAPLFTPFQPVFNSLLSLPVTVLIKDAVTVCAATNALACAHVHTGLQRAFRESRSAPVIPPVAAAEPTEPPAKGVRSPSPNPKLRKTDSKKEAAQKATEKNGTVVSDVSKSSAGMPSAKGALSDVLPAGPPTDGQEPVTLGAVDGPPEDPSYTELLSWGVGVGRKMCENAPEFLAAAEVCSKALEKLSGVDESVLKTLVATQARIQGLRGLQGATAGDQAGGSSAKAVALIEVASNIAESTGVRVRAVSDAVEALQKADGKEGRADSVKLELWTKLGQGALALGDLQKAISCCRSARGVGAQLGGKVPAADKENAPQRSAAMKPQTLPPYHCYWLSLAESVEGQATALLINPVKQSPAAQDSVRVKALERLLEAMRWGGRAGRVDLMCRATALWWNAALPLANNAPGRALLHATCQPLLEALLAARVRALPPELYASLFSVLLESLAESEEWEEGLKWTDLAVRNTPPAQHKLLWAMKTKFMVKMGRPMSEELDRTADKDEEVRARMWATLAAQSDDAFERLTAHQRAIDALEETPWMQVPYMIQYAEYLASQGYPSTDSEDVLLCAADILHDLEDEDENEEPDLERGSQSRGGGGSIASGSMHSRQRRSTVTSSKQGGGSVAGRSAVGGGSLRGSQNGSLRGSQHGSLRGSQHGSLRPSQAATRRTLVRGTSQASGSRKGSVVGGSTLRSGVTSASASGASLLPSEAKRLQYLLLVYTALAKVSTGLNERRENALLAQHFGVRFLRHVLGEVNGHVAEKRAAIAEVAAAAVDQESRVTRTLSKAVGSAVTTRPSRLGGSLSSVTAPPLAAEQPAPVAIPHTPSEWTRIDLAEQVKAGLTLRQELEVTLAKALKDLGISAVAKPGGSKNKLNGSDVFRKLAKKIKGLDALMREDGQAASKDPLQEAIDDPSGLLATVESLEVYLRQAGLYLHALPLRQLAFVIADVAMGRADVVLTQRVAMVSLLDVLALREEAAAWEKSLGVLTIGPDVKRKAKEEIEQRREARRLAASKAPAEPIPDDFAPEALKKVDTNERNRLPRPKVLPLHSRHAWLAAARFLTTRGRFSDARAFATEARAHALEFDDTPCAAGCGLLLARLTLLENSHSQAMSLLKETVASGASVSDWVEHAVAAAQIWSEELPRGSGFAKARTLLKAGAERFAALAKGLHSQSKPVSGGIVGSGITGMGLDAAIAEATLMQELAGVVTSESRHSLQTGDRSRALKTAREAVDTLTACCDRWRELGGGAACLPAKLAYVAAVEWLERLETPGLDCESAAASPRGAEARRRALLDTLEEGRKLLQIAKTPATSAMSSLPIARQTAQVLEGLARTELALAAAAGAACEVSSGAVEFPLVEGRNSATVKQYVEEAEAWGLAAVQKRREANREQANEERALMYASEALALLPENPDLCHVAASLHCTVGTCLLSHAARETRNEETLRKIRQRSEGEDELEEPLNDPSGVVGEAGPSFPLGGALEPGQTEPSGFTSDACESGTQLLAPQQNGGLEEGSRAANETAADGIDSTLKNRAKAAETKEEGPSETVASLQKQGVNALETAIAYGLREGRFDVVLEAATRLADFHAQEGAASSDSKCAEYLALAQSCKARGFLKATLENACASDDAQILALRKLECAKSRGSMFTSWPEPPFADFSTFRSSDVTSVEAAVAAAAPCAWGLLESVKKQVFADAVARLPADATGLILHLDEDRGTLFAVSIGPLPVEMVTEPPKGKRRSEDGSRGKEKSAKATPGKTGGKEKTVVTQKEEPRSGSIGETGIEATKDKERRIEVRKLELGSDSRPLLEVVKNFEVWRVQAKRAVARAHVAPPTDPVDADVATVEAPAKPGANGTKPKRKESISLVDTKRVSETGRPGQKPPEKTPGGKLPRASSRAGGRASKPPSRPISRLQRKPLDADLDDRWTTLIERMGELLLPLTDGFVATAGCVSDAGDTVESNNSRPTEVTNPVEGFSQGGAPVVPLAPRQVILFLDSSLAPLPLEALPEFQSPLVTSVSRDFSLAVFAHRVARAAAQKPTQTPVLDLRNLCYIVDLRNEDKPQLSTLPTRVTPPLAEAFLEVGHSLAGNLSSKEWKGLMGSDHIPSDGEIQRLVATSSGMIYVGLGRFLAYVSAAALAALDLGACQLAVLAGMSVSEESLRRQAYLDNRKSYEARGLEQPHATAALLTLAGVSTVAINQGVSTVDANQALLGGLLQALTGQPLFPVGPALREATSKVDAPELRSLSTNMVLYGLPHLSLGG